MKNNTYDNKFYDYINHGSTLSAEIIVPLVLNKIDINSVLDVGCGQGAWLSVWLENGVSDVTGIDGDYVSRDKLLVDSEKFIAHDLSKKIDLGRKFDIVQSLEVAEHVHEEYSEVFISNLTRHSQAVLFSAATKGQGGDEHINEQHYDYWRKIFFKFDYIPIDYIRKKVDGNKQVEPWYRYNTFLYVHKSCVDRLSSELRENIIMENQVLVDVSPSWYKARKLIIRCLPVTLATMLAKLKESFTVKMR